MSHWMVGQLELQTGDLESAVASLERSQRLDPSFPPPYLALAAAYSQQGRFESVARQLEKYLELQPDHVVAHLYLGECLLCLRRTEDARRHFAAFVEECRFDDDRRPDRVAQACRRLEELAGERGDVFEAYLYGGIRCVYEARLAPNDPSQTEDLERKHLEEAIARLRQANRERPVDPEARRRLADAMSTLQRHHSIANAPTSKEITLEPPPLPPNDVKRTSAP